MAGRFVLPFADVGGGISPSDGAQLFFFDTGTANERDTFSDEALTTANANPVIANADGVFSDIFLTDLIDYKAVLKDKNNVQIWEADPVTSQPLDQESLGGILWPISTAESSFGLTDSDLDRNFFYGNLLRYKADPTGAEDSFQAMTDALGTHPGEVYVPPGTFRNTSSVGTFIVVTVDMSISGEGPASILAGFSIQPRNISCHLESFKAIEVDAPFMHVEGVDGFVCRNCTFVAGIVSASPRAFRILVSHNGLFESCSFITNGTSASVWQYPIWIQAFDSNVSSPITGILTASKTGNQTHWRIIGCYFENEDSATGTAGFPAAINLVNVEYIAITGCTFKEWPTRAAENAYGIFQGDPGVSDPRTMKYLTIADNAFDNCSDNCIGLHEGNTIAITGNVSNETTTFVKLFGDVSSLPADSSAKQQNVTISDNATKGRIVITDGVDDLVIEGNTITDSPTTGIFLNGKTAPDNARNVVINGNTIIRCGDTAIFCQNTQRVSATDNMIFDANEDANASGNADNNACIRYSICDDTLTTGNQFINTSGSGAHYGISFNTIAGKHKYDRSNSFILMQTAGLRGHYTTTPASGDWEEGEVVYIFGNSVDGNNMLLSHLYCTVSGNPGTWVGQYVSTVSPAT